MKINELEIANIIIALLLIFTVIRKRDLGISMLALFIYGTLHFSFAAFALADDESESILILMHTEGSGVLARVATFILLLVVFVQWGLLAYRNFQSSTKSDRKVALFLLFVMFSVLVGYLFNIRAGDWIQLRNVVVMEAMFVLVLFGYLSATKLYVLRTIKIRFLGNIVLLLLVIMDSIAIYEVFGHHSWAGTLESSGAMVYRASSLLFNPNLFGFWASLVYLACSYGMHAYHEFRKVMLSGMILTSIAIYLSGSRSAGYLLLGILFISLLLIRERRRWLPLIMLPASMLSIYAISAWLVPIFISGSAGWRSVALLGERFAAAPIYLISYLLRLSGIPAEIMLSIEGRYMGERMDAGWLVLYQDVGWIGVAGVIGGACILILRGFSVYFAQLKTSSVYALSILFYCLFSGLVMRFQIFPVWLYISIVLILCLNLWRESSLLNEHGGG